MGSEAVAMAVDRGELERIARAELPRVERLLLRILGPRSDMDDLIQTVFLELSRSWGRFRGESQVSTFVGGITIRVARRAMRPPAWVRFRSVLLGDPADARANPHRETAVSELMARVRECLEDLPPKKRIAFCLWALEGLSVEEIAELTVANPATVKTRIYDAQRTLKARAKRDPILKELLQNHD